MKDLYLYVIVGEFGKDSFEVQRDSYDIETDIFKNSVLKIDYDYRPWPIKGGNLLW